MMVYTSVKKLNKKKGKGKGRGGNELMSITSKIASSFSVAMTMPSTIGNALRFLNSKPVYS